MLAVLCVLAFVYGVRFTLNQTLHPVDLLLVWGMDIVTILICAQDARQRGRVLLNSYRWIMFFTWPLSIWFYYLWCRGLKGLGLVLLWSLIITAIYVAGGMVVILVVG
jgi:hypothetical protein